MNNGAQFSSFSFIYSSPLNVSTGSFLWPANLQGDFPECIPTLNETHTVPLRSALHLHKSDLPQWIHDADFIFESNYSALSLLNNSPTSINTSVVSCSDSRAATPGRKCVPWLAVRS